MSYIFAKVDPKLKKKWQAILKNQSFTEQLVIEKYVQRAVYEGRIDVTEWA